MSSTSTTMTELAKRYGAYSDGGPSGEDVLAAIMAIAAHVLHPHHGRLAVVSEFFLQERAKKVPLPADASPKPVSKVLVMGAGTMGSTTHIGDDLGEIPVRVGLP